ncbi:hypothetical protein V12B01_13585 [Vibrio splendidus 12B01]|nr:hypothetical protein V12B01_13585 [Vibrio splendidus 12B01]
MRCGTPYVSCHSCCLVDFLTLRMRK